MTDPARRPPGPMRVLHVATLATPDGAYGGPLRVATNLCTALGERGHRATITSGERGHERVPDEVAGVQAYLFPAHTAVPGIGFAGLTSGGLLRSLRRRRHEFDLVHVHLARDLITLPAARMATALGLPTVLQTHGMIDPSSNALARPLDLALTRPVLRRAGAVLYLTDRERSDLVTVGARESTLRALPNGVPAPTGLSGPRVPGDRPQVLFLARLHPRKRATEFVRAAAALLESGVQADFAVVGPDEGDAAAVRALIDHHADHIRYEGPLSPDRTGERLARADAYVLPSVDEPFPMTVLEAMAAGLPVVVTDSCGLAPAITASGSGLVIDRSSAQLIDAMRTIITDADTRRAMGARAADTVARQFSIDAVTDELIDIYDNVLRAGRRE